MRPAQRRCGHDGDALVGDFVRRPQPAADGGDGQREPHQGPGHRHVGDDLAARGRALVHDLLGAPVRAGGLLHGAHDGKPRRPALPWGGAWGGRLVAGRLGRGVHRRALRALAAEDAEAGLEVVLVRGGVRGGLLRARAHGKARGLRRVEGDARRDARARDAEARGAADASTGVATRVVMANMVVVSGGGGREGCASSTGASASDGDSFRVSHIERPNATRTDGRVAAFQRESLERGARDWSSVCTRPRTGKKRKSRMTGRLLLFASKATARRTSRRAFDGGRRATRGGGAMRTSYVNVATPSASGRPPPGRQPTARAPRARPPPRALSVASANISSRRRPPRRPPRRPRALRGAEGRARADASIPHLQSDHLPVFLYQTVVLVAGAEIKLVLPESEDLVSTCTPRRPARRRPALGDAVAGLGGARGGGAVQPGAGARQARAGPRHGPRARGHSRGARRRRGGGVDRSRAARVVLRVVRGGGKRFVRRRRRRRRPRVRARGRAGA